MCAIGGIYLRPGGQLAVSDYLEAMLCIQRHRGPDGEGVWLAPDGFLGLAHNRLAVLDLTELGGQPMSSTDGRFVVVFNGEIYNYQELQRELNTLGADFRSHSDTEVIIEAFRYWGEGMLQRLRGMFSFTIYDKHTRSLLCARDRVGKKPFVYAQTASAFVFASEIPAVRQVAGVDTTFDHDAIAAMLLHNLRHIPDPHTAYRGIKRLRAGHAMVVREGRVERIWRYWKPAIAEGPFSQERLRELIEESISLRMHADVPVGALLSGGVDSSAIVALMQRKSADPIRTYALGFDKDDEDLRRARIMSKALGTVHREFYFDPQEQWEIFRMLLRIYGEPIMLLPLVHTYALCRAIRDDNIKVVLTGNGADELFYGYTGHIRTLKLSRWLDRLSPILPLCKPLKNTRLGWVSENRGARKAAWYRWLAKTEWTHFLSKDAQSTLANRAAEELDYWGVLSPSNHFIDESNFVGLMVENPHSVTIAGDLPAMAASVEIRAPFLDQEIVSFALGTPVEKKIPDAANPDWLKAILRESVRDIIPKELLTAPKRGMGMGIQEADVLRGPWKRRVDELFQSANDANGLIDSSRVKVEWKEFLSGKAPASRVSKMLAIQMWLQMGLGNASE
ncbi:asparagine synthase (glutamine-hydrolyzing) [Thiomicrospira sp.]|uniref:asparagine synthase (glutamine-hydrolyzing) n=1 Tax=Thiomicrospira sp. TaxID=935 RepID=UPI002F92D768